MVAAGTEGSLRVAFVSAPGSSVFMVELLAAVAEAVARLGRVGLEAITHRGLVSEVADARTVSVVVPHEYYVLAPPEPESLRARTVAFGVEHPGTEEFETSVRYAAGLAGRFEISVDSIEELARRGIDAVHFPLGLVPAWDSRQEGRDRDVDVAYLGTADERRIGILARAARDLAGLRTELVLAPHEQMTAARPDFLAGRDKWALLARSKVLVNLHRGTKTALEWVRVLEAITNGCAVVTEPSDDLGPLRADEHLLVAEPDDVGRVAAALARDEPRRAALAEAAHELCRTELDMAAPAARLVDACLRAAAATPAAGARHSPTCRRARAPSRGLASGRWGRSLGAARARPRAAGWPRRRRRRPTAAWQCCARGWPGTAGSRSRRPRSGPSSPRSRCTYVEVGQRRTEGPPATGWSSAATSRSSRCSTVATR